jgi:hypothetical protein
MSSDTSFAGKLGWFCDQETQIAWNAATLLKEPKSKTHAHTDKALQTFMRQQHLIQQVIDPIDDALIKMLPEMIKNEKVILVYSPKMVHRLKFLDLLYIPPHELVDEKADQHGPCFPYKARERGCNYEMTLVVRVLYQRYARDLAKEATDPTAPENRRFYKPKEAIWGPLVDENVLEFNRGKMTIMMGSKMCHMRLGHPKAVHHELAYVIGGLLICNGTEKTLPPVLDKQSLRYSNEASLVR